MKQLAKDKFPKYAVSHTSQYQKNKQPNQKLVERLKQELLQCRRVKSKSEVAQSCPTRSSVHGIFQVRVLEWVAISSSRASSLTQGLNLHLLCLPALVGGIFFFFFFTMEPLQKPSFSQSSSPVLIPQMNETPGSSVSVTDLLK